MNGAQMAREMAQQPSRLRDLVARTGEIAERVGALGPSSIGGLCIVPRGSSDHAATYGRYLLEPATGKPVSLAAPSLHTLYRFAVDYRGQLVVGVSQSGRTPEIVATLAMLRDAGGCALAITNDPTSELARAAGAVIELGVGEELAVPATKRMSERVVAIDVGGTFLKGALVDRRGRVVEQERRPSAVANGPEAVMQAVVGLAQELTAAGKASPAGVGKASLAGVGLAVPRLVDERERRVITAANIGWRDLEIGSIVENRLGMPVTVVHDVRAGAMAEGLRGAARGASDYLLITLGTGIGAAVVIGGGPYTGAHGVGGELGHMAIEPRGPICGCGRAGCLEALASASHTSSRYQTMTGGSEPVGAEEVAARAAGADPGAGEVWSMATEALATGVANYAALLDPELVVVGGGMAAAGDRLFVPLRSRLAARMRFGDPPPVVPAALGQEAGRLGAAIAAWRAAGIDEAGLSAWEP